MRARGRPLTLSLSKGELARGPASTSSARARSRLTVAAALALFASSPAQADTLIDNIEGLSLDADGRVLRFNGLLIGNDGRIAQVLQRSDKRPGKVDYRLDGKGRVIMPGLVDARIHLMDLALPLLTAKPNPNAGTLSSRLAGPPRPEDRDLALAEAQQALLARGITAVTDMGTTIEDWQTYRRAGDLGTLHLRIIAYAASTEAMILIGGPGPTPWLYDDRLRLNGLFLRYAPAAPATARKPAGLNETQLRNMMSRAAMDRFQVAVEAPGEAGVTAVADAVDELALTYQGERRWRIEGATAVAATDLPRLARHKVTYGFQPRDDASASPPLPQPFAGMAAALTRDGTPGQPAARMTREEALAGWTIKAAFAGQAEGRFGRLATGQRADFIMLGRDPTLASTTDLRAVRVLQTWIGGRMVYQSKVSGQGSDQGGGD